MTEHDETGVSPSASAPQHGVPGAHGGPAHHGAYSPPPAYGPYPAHGGIGHGGPVPGAPAHAGHTPPRRGPVALLSAVAMAAALLGGGTAVGVEHLLDQGAGTSVSAPVTSGSNAAAGAKGGSVAAVAKAVGPSVVEIKAASGGGTATGSGVVLTKDGQILTNNHVVAGSDSVHITFSDGTRTTAQVVGTDADHDLALVRAAHASGLHPAVLGDSDRVSVGDEVVAIGSPEGLSNTVTSGIVSAKDREVTVPKESGQQQGGSQDEGRWPFEFGGHQFNGGTGGDSTTTYKALQTDASLNPGNSGGALVNSAGQVIGINSANFSSSGSSDSGDNGSVGLGFAIPVNTVKAQLADLQSGGSVNG